jgi:hypothetical protein
MISKKYHLISIFLILSLSIVIDAGDSSGNSYIYFDRFMLNFVNSYRAKLESNISVITPKEERMYFIVFDKLLSIRREMENELYKNAWYLRRGR